MNRKLTLKIFSAVMAFALIFGVLSFTVSAAASADYSVKSSTEKPDFNYVALGASNTAGYGLHGYNYDWVYEYPNDKYEGNRYGYKMNPPDSYPVLIAEQLNKTYNTNLEVIAMSSMRAEEMHVLLDNNYIGDKYTDNWLFDMNGDGTTFNWGYNSGVYEYKRLASLGVDGYNTDPDYVPTAAEALAALRYATQDSVKNADLITVDVGMNNFGTYMFNLIVEGWFSNDLGEISPELNKYYDDMREYAIGIIKSVVGDSIPEGMLRNFANTLAYAAVGYCLNTDAVMARIFELNPDAEVVLIGAESMLHGLEIVMPGFDGVIPFGEIFDLIVNACNLYGAVLSPYSDKYYFASVSENGHVEFLKNEAANYNGDPSTIPLHMKDCFNVLDGGMLLKTRVQQMFAVQMAETGFINMTDAQKDMLDITAFHNGFHYDRYDNTTYPPITLADGSYFKDFIKKGEAGQLGGDAKTTYEIYERMLTLAYDVAMEVFGYASQQSMVNLNVTMNPALSGVKAAAILLDVLGKAMVESATDANYSFDLDTMYPNGFFETYEQENGLPAGTLASKFTFALFLEFAESAFSHPNYEGHREVFEKSWAAYTEKITGRDVIIDQISVDYMPTEDSYYVSIGGGNADYADIFASNIGLTKDQVAHITWDNLDYSKIDNADLISIGFSEEEILGFSVDQVFAYIGNYINTTARNTLINYVEAIIKRIPLLKGFEEGVKTEINGVVDGILAVDYFAGKTIQPMNWADILDEEQLAVVDLARSELKNGVIGVLGSETLTLPIDVVELLYANADSMGIGGVLNNVPSNVIYNILKEDAILNIEVPVADGVVFAMETYIYKYVEYTVRSNQLIAYVGRTNPDARIVVLGHFNPIKSTYLQLGETTINAGEMYGLLALASTGRSLLQYSASNNSTFAYIQDANSKFDVMVQAGEAQADLFSFLSLFNEDRSIVDVSSESAEYIATQMLYYVEIKCDHKYDGDCDTVCNKCEEVREVSHFFDGCDDTTCDNCGFTRDASEHTLSDCVDTVCDVCGKTVTAIGHSFGDWTAKGEEESRVCSACGHTESRPVAAEDDGDEKDGLSTGAVIGIVAGSVAVLGGGGFGAYWFLIRKKNPLTAVAETAAEAGVDAPEVDVPSDEQ